MAIRLLHDVHKRVLPNGLTAIVNPDRSLPVVCLNFFVRVGSNDETDDVWGWSHGIEHMLFKGTARRQVGDIAREVSNLGGSLNAGTGYEFTNYHITLPSEGFSQALDIHADVLLNSAFDAEELERERNVLIEELKMYEDVPDGFGRSWNEVMRLAFTRHPYRRSIIGSKERLESTPREAILDYFRRSYVPERIVYAVAGDVDPESALDEIERALAPMSGRSGNGAAEVEPEQTAFRYGEIRGPVEMSYYKIAYHIPEERHADAAALQVLSNLLGGGRSSRLHKHVSERQGLVSAIDVIDLAGRDPGVMLIDATASPEKLDDAIRATYDEIHHFHTEPISETDLEKALNNVIVGFVSALETVQGQASVVGQFEAMGDYRWAREYPDRVAAVTRDDVMRVARTYLAFDKSSLLTYRAGEWSDLDRSEEAAVEARLRSTMAPVGEAKAAGEDASPRKATLAARSSEAAEEGAMRRETLPGGSRLLMRSTRKHPMVAVAATLPGGSRFEPLESEGCALLTARTLLKGTTSRTNEALAEEVDRYGITLAPYFDSDTTGFYVEALSEHLDRALDLFADVLLRPAFDPREVDHERAMVLADLAQQEDDTVSATMVRFRQRLFGDHPYGRNPHGRADTLKTLTPDDLRRWHERFLVPEDLCISAVGDFDPAELTDGLSKRLGALSSRERPGGERPAPAEAPGLYQIVRDRQQSVIVVGYPAPSLHADERYALLVLNGVLSGMGSRLFTELRDKRHLCYFTSSGYSALDEAGSFTAYLGTSPEQTAEALAALQSELDRARTDAPTEEELTRAINSITGSHLISLQRNGSQASRFARLEALGIGYERLFQFPDRVRAVTGADVVEAARQVIVPDRAVAAVAAPAPLSDAVVVD